MVTYNELVVRYGKKLAYEIISNKFMQGIGCKVKNGELDYFEYDVMCAIDDINKE